LKKQLEELNRWIATINQYTRIYENAAGQLTILKGILRTADELLSLSRDWVRRTEMAITLRY